jgi:hypothetical protein
LPSKAKSVALHILVISTHRAFEIEKDREIFEEIETRKIGKDRERERERTVVGLGLEKIPLDSSSIVVPLSLKFPSWRKEIEK